MTIFRCSVEILQILPNREFHLLVVLVHGLDNTLYVGGSGVEGRLWLKVQKERCLPFDIFKHTLRQWLKMCQAVEEWIVYER